MLPLRRPFLLSVFFLVFLSVMSTGCSSPSPDGFALYLTRDDVSPAQMEMLSHVDLADVPLISMRDIVSYDPSSCELVVTRQTYERVAALKVPTSGTSFVVCVDGSPVYWGAFWTLVSSQSFDGVTIWQPVLVGDPSVLTLRLGYPGPSPYHEGDPRNVPVVLQAFERAGKLKGSLPATEPLPDAPKGYELYSWERDGQWHFKLITGTNRMKSLQEVLSAENTVTADDWVNIHCVGVDGLDALLGRLPAGEDVFWLGGTTVEGGGVLTIPPRDVTDAVVEYAAQCGLNLSVPARVE